jgi:hypothetical protein
VPRLPLTKAKAPHNLLICFPPLISRTRLEVILSDVNKDPTLQRSRDVVCANCNMSEAVLFQVSEPFTLN